MRCALLAMLAACRSGPEPAIPAADDSIERTQPPSPRPDAMSFSSDPRPEQDRSIVPRALAPQLPRRGVYAAGGGIVSSAWRVSIDLETATASFGHSAAAGASSIGKMERQWSAELDAPALRALIEAADAAWREPPPDGPPSPTADYSELLVLCDGDAIHYHDGYGPIRRPRAATLVERLRALLQAHAQ